MLRTEPILKKTVERIIQHPSGTLKNQITKKDLMENAKKYVQIYPSFYENAKTLAHEANTRSVARKKVGKKVRIASVKTNGISYNVFVGKQKVVARKLEAKKKPETNQFADQIKAQAKAIAELKAKLEAKKEPETAKKPARKKATKKEE